MLIHLTSSFLNSSMLYLGENNNLEILRSTTIGVFLGDEEGNDVLLPNKYVPKTGAEIGAFIDVFIYRDGEERLIATTLVPKIKLNNFAMLKVNSVNSIGAFMDWGLEKDLLVPFKEQPKKMLKGKYYTVFMYIDEKTDRLVGSAKVYKYLNNEELTVAENDEVEILIWDYTDIGVNVIVNNRHKGLIYKDQIFGELMPGQRKTAYITKIREENKLDVRLEKTGYAQVEPNAQKILKKLQDENGMMKLTDKSAPDEIYFQLQMSKKTFKKALGALYKQRIIRIEKDGVYLVDK